MNAVDASGTDGPAPPAWRARLAATPRRWLLTGSAGFVGSHLLQALLEAGQHVTSVDDFSTGLLDTLDQVRLAVGEAAWRRHRFIEGDLADPAIAEAACDGAALVLHQAALGSVPRSLHDPLATHRANVTGFENLLEAAQRAGVGRIVYASSSAVYGDAPQLPKREPCIGEPLSPYGASKRINELQAAVHARCYGLRTVGLRYFNLFGPRQNPQGPYAAVIARWTGCMLRGVPCRIDGDGSTTRDFSPVANAVQANVLAALTDRADALDQVYNVALGGQTGLLQLHAALADALQRLLPGLQVPPPEHGPRRPGDIAHSLADIDKARRLLGYRPAQAIAPALTETLAWHIAQHGEAPAAAPGHAALPPPAAAQPLAWARH